MLLSAFFSSVITVLLIENRPQDEIAKGYKPEVIVVERLSPDRGLSPKPNT